MLHVALSYLALGLSVIPVVFGKKTPCIGWREYQTRLPAVDEATAWWGRFPDAGIAIICGAVSDVIVLDVESHALWVLRDYAMPWTAIARTQSGGEHHYFRYEPDLRTMIWRDYGRHLGELRADGAYVVAPPSVGPVGTYSWRVPIAARGISEAPHWLAQLRRVEWPGTARAVSPRASGPRRRASRSECDHADAIAMLADGRHAAEVAAALAGRDSVADRGHAGAAYVSRTLRNAKAWVDEHVHAAVIVGARLRGDRVFIQFHLCDGRDVALGLNFPPDVTSASRWESLAAATGRRLPEDLGLLAGADVRLELVGTRVGRIFRSGTTSVDAGLATWTGRTRGGCGAR